MLDAIQIPKKPLFLSVESATHINVPPLQGKLLISTVVPKNTKMQFLMS